MLHDCRNCRHKGNNSEDRCRGCWKGGVWRRWEAAESPWIPVTERLPKVEGVYMESSVSRRLVYYASEAVLICEEDGTMFVSWLMAGADDPEAEYNPHWMDEVGNIVDIEPVAWMPLPEPYNPEKEATINK